MFRFDESDPHFLIAYEEEHEHSIAPYQDLMRRWAARHKRGDIFGVILVHEDHDHNDAHHEEEQHYERDVAYEEAFTKLLNDFRRDHKSDIERCTVGYVRIFPTRWLNEQLGQNPLYLDELRSDQDRAARYMFGMPGNVFLTVDEARAWIDMKIASFVPPAEAPFVVPPAVAPPSGKRVGLFYGSTTGMTEMIALEIQTAWAAHGMKSIRAVNIGVVKNLSKLLEYDSLILGIPTWNVGQLQDDWEIAFTQLDTLDFTGRHVALFGVGDQYGYPDNFLDAVGILGMKMIERGATLVGRWNDDQYEFVESKAFVDGKFMGLALDEVQQAEHSDRRIHQWVAQIIAEFALQPVAPYITAEISAFN